MSNRFRYDALQDREAIVAYLESLTEGIRQGHIEISHKGETLVLSPQGLIDFIFEAKVSEDERKLAIKLRWKECPQEGQDTQEPLVLKPGKRANDV
ncbi:hypothetical protein PCS_00762 [Desulfocurvibacter africanus PCS]|uniref:Uncharacterized protein n=1 Tax=Desulfocurvibacter africanus PCS TaxID=1262666 RepID=M5PWP1_DESAF|nr:amphi-Trp domain-containing protein [Desulfocurvibacter africanus]EMG38464.1 hypothetical protein PCS_00762 [Desulfocurvibacter africanus PCS]